MARKPRGIGRFGSGKAFPRSKKVSRLTPPKYPSLGLTDRGTRKAFPSSGIGSNPTTSTNPTTKPAGGGGGGKGPLYPGYLTPAQIRAAALADANLQYGMDAREFRLLRDEELKRAAKRAQAIQGFTTAAAGMMQGAGPAVQGAYQSAAKDQAAFAKGFSDATAHVASQTADTANQRLTALGNTGTPVTGDTGAADVLYGLGGYIPASTMEREGAAFSAQAAAYPQATLGEGAIAFRGALQSGEDAARGFDARLKSLAIQKGMTVSQLIKQARREQAGLSIQARNEKINQYKWEAQQAAQARRDEYQMGYLALREAKDQQSRDVALSQMNGVVYSNGKVVTGKDGQPLLTATERDRRAKEERLTRANEASITGIDPVTGQPTYRAGNDQANRDARARAARERAAAKAANAKVKAANATKTQRAKSLKGRTAAYASLDKATVSAGRSGLGKPQKNPVYGVPLKPGNKFKYLDRNGKPTNDPKKADVSGRVNGDKILTQVYQGYGTTLEARYGVPKAQILERIRRKLRALGYKV